MADPDRVEQFSPFITLARAGRVVVVTYDRGDGLNALSVQGMRELKAVAQHLAEDDTSSAIILQGQGVFSAGADLKDPARDTRETQSLVAQRTAMKLGPDMCQAWADLEQITIAAIEGFCIGGGLALVAACDHRIAAKDSHFRLPEVPLGMNMSWRSVPRLAALMGPSRAKLLTILGEKVSAQIGFEWGLVDTLCEPGNANAEALDLATRYGAMPPLAVRMCKQAIDASTQPLAHATSFMDRDQFLLTSMTEDQSEAIAAFLEKRTPKFTGN